MKSRDDHLFGPGPKRILALDGGGVRGIVSLAFLERIEAILAAKATAAGRDDSTPQSSLCDHFDLIGGTSTGAILATGLAMGRPVSDLIDIYLNLAHRAFRGQRWLGGLLAPKFRSSDLLTEIKTQVGDTILGDASIRTGLAIVAKRIDTDSPWVFHNNPRSRYFEAPEDDPGAVPNSAFPLHEILRASTAAPTYYEPEPITVAEGVEGVFVDGGVSPYNNPALLLFMMATSRAYGYCWPAGADNLALVSVGTGLGGPRRVAQSLLRMPSALMAVEALQSVITDCTWQAQALLQWLGTTPTPWDIDSEAGDLSDQAPVESLLRYHRYDILLQDAWLREVLDESCTADEIEHLAAIDRVDVVDDLLRLARRAAAMQVRPEHFEDGPWG